MKRCGLIKDLKTRYFMLRIIKMFFSCGLIKDLKTRYSLDRKVEVTVVVV